MKQQPFQWTMLIRMVLLFATLTIAAFVIVTGTYQWLLLLLPLIGYQLFLFYRSAMQVQEEVNNFAAGIRYRDFSRKFNVEQAPASLRTLRSGFNSINEAFREISREKETQFLYLQQMLELVDTGILSYETATGEVGWMNESLKNLLQIPYLKSVHAIAKRNEPLYQQLMQLKPGKSLVMDLQQHRRPVKIMLTATAFETDQKRYQLVAFQNVHEALDENESVAWQRLLSVLTHEIMNSVAPISSLADTLQNRLEASEGTLHNNNELLEDLDAGMKAIRKRSQGLLHFAQVYRSLNKVSQPALKQVYIRDLFENIYRLMAPMLEQKNIELEIVLKEADLLQELDSSLIEQVIINLIINAADAVKEVEHPRIVLSAEREQDQNISIRVTDNGAGMGPEILNNIFIPFFTTKKNGSGIGLNLCKQIMRLHKGYITVYSEEGKGSSFLLGF
jgi:signal transduction histidine kinase